MFLIGTVICFILVIGFIIIVIMSEDVVTWVIFGGLALFSFGGGYYLQTHRIIPTQYGGISKSAVTQELSEMQDSGLVKKPFFGSVYMFPTSSSYERCEKYTPALKGSYGIVVDACFYYDTGNVDWMREINRTGSLDADKIMDNWRNGVVGAVAASFKDYTPEQLSADRSIVEASLYDNVLPWMTERGIPLTRVSFKNWDFGSETVSAAFDESIGSQRKIVEEGALFDAAVIARERKLYEAETSGLVAEQQSLALEELGFTGDNAIEYMWIKHFSDNDKVPDTLILGGSVPVTVPSQ